MVGKEDLQRGGFVACLGGVLFGEDGLGAVKQAEALGFIQLEVLPEAGDVGVVEAVGRELLLFMQADVAVGELGTRDRIAGPDDVEDRVEVLDELGEALEAVGDLAGDGVEVHAAALLEVGELGDLLAVEHDLPADAPGTADGPLPVVFLELDVVLREVDADGDERLQIEVLHALGWWL
jgi:hypothetical protein